jgi:hypothetical protein
MEHYKRASKKKIDGRRQDTKEAEGRGGIDKQIGR